MKVYEKFDQKTGMNENREVYSLIERNLLYKMHYFVSSPTVILKGASVNNIFYWNYPANFDAYSRKISMNCFKTQFKTHPQHEGFVKTATLMIFILNYATINPILIVIRGKQYQYGCINGKSPVDSATTSKFNETFRVCREFFADHFGNLIF